MSLKHYLNRARSRNGHSYDDDTVEALEKQLDPYQTERKARRSRKPKTQHKPKKTQGEIVAEIADADALEGGFKTTYQPSRYEEGYLLDALHGFYAQAMIADVLAVVKGGKEATVYCCAAHDSMDTPLVAAKVYRPRMFRQLRNDKLYREGREILTGEGRPIKATDQRIIRALGKKSAFGVEVEQTSWLLHEYKTLRTLHAAGAAVPKPYAVGENAILMGYVGDERMAAPLLSEVRLDTDEARSLFDETMRSVELILQAGLVHGDLSAYNILYWEGQITIIDFPQVTGLRANRSAHMILERDIERVCEYFARQGVARNGKAIARWMWNKYARKIEEERVFNDEMWAFGREYVILDSEE